MQKASGVFLIAALLSSGVSWADVATVFPGTPAELQKAIDAAPSNSVVHCDPNLALTCSQPITIRRPVQLVGLHARLPEKLGNISIVVVEVAGVSITDFRLIGNADSVPQSERVPLMAIYAGDFRVERGTFINSSKDGVMIDGDHMKEGDLVGGVVRDIVGRDVVRDVVSISGSSGNGPRIRNVLVDNVRCYNSRLRGAVEVSDGTDNITVRKVFAESAVYAVDVQDHNKPGQANRNVVIEDVYAVRSKHALRTANSRKGHDNLTIRGITADQCVVPVQISHTANLHLSNVRVLNHGSGKTPVQLQDCHGVSVRDVVVENATLEGPALLLENCDEAIVDGFSLRGASNRLASAVCFSIHDEGQFFGAARQQRFCAGCDRCRDCVGVGRQRAGNRDGLFNHGQPGDGAGRNKGGTRGGDEQCGAVE